MVTCRLDVGAGHVVCFAYRYFASDLFFLVFDVWASDRIDVCTQTRRLQFFFFFRKKFAHRKTSTKPDNVNNTHTMTKNLCR